MLFDPKWAPTEIKLEPWQEILLRAADILEEHGWVQGQIGYDGEGYCAFGAMIKALATVNHMGLDDAMMKLGNAVATIGSPFDSAIFRWNDREDRTKEQVISKMREVANAV